MRRNADLHPGKAKDAAVIADAARTMPYTLCSLKVTDEITAELTVLTGFEQDLASEATRTSNRIRGLLTQIHPILERTPGPHLAHIAMTWRLKPHESPRPPTGQTAPPTRILRCPLSLPSPRKDPHPNIPLPRPPPHQCTFRAAPRRHLQGNPHLSPRLTKDARALTERLLPDSPPALPSRARRHRTALDPGL